MLTNRTKPNTTASRYLLAASLLTLGTSACAGKLDVADDPAADGGNGGGGSGGGGSGGESNGGTGSGATTTTGSGPEGQNTSGGTSGSEGQSTSTTGASTDSSGVSPNCGTQICDPGSYCFAAPSGAASEEVCAPTCEVQPAELRGKPCPHSITGEEGLCAAFLGFLPSEGAYTPMGVCSDSCDPLEPDCPEGFSCTMTEDGDGDGGPIPLIFACMPVLQSSPVGSECSGAPTGDCEPGAECIGDLNGYTCRAYCDTREDDACPESQYCERPYWFPAGSPVGYCTE